MLRASTTAGPVTVQLYADGTASAFVGEPEEYHLEGPTTSDATPAAVLAFLDGLIADLGKARAFLIENTEAACRRRKLSESMILKHSPSLLPGDCVRGHDHECSLPEDVEPFAEDPANWSDE